MLIRISEDLMKWIKLGSSEGEKVLRAIDLLDIGLAVNGDIQVYANNYEAHEERFNHTEKGYSILNALGEDKSICNTILSHHELYDGTGMPRGLKGEEIPIASRIIHLSSVIADGVIDIQSGRLTVSDLISQIKVDRVSQFDPELIPYITNEWIKEFLHK